jgi:hypothetical protein
MNTTRLIAAIAITFAASGAAMAQQATYDYPQVVTSQVTRAEVLAQLQAARADGSLIVNEASVGTTPSFMAQRSRPLVRAEAVLALKSGLVNALTAEPHGFTVAAAPVDVAIALASK